MCYGPTHMASTVGVRELRQNLSKYLARVKEGETFDVTERGLVVARLSPSGDMHPKYAELAEKLGVKPPAKTDIGELRRRFVADPDVTDAGADELLDEMRRDRD